MNQDDMEERDRQILAGMSKPKLVQTKPQLPPMIQTAETFIANYKPFDYVIDKLIIRGYLYGLTSRPNHGKTTVATSIALHVANDRPFAGLEVSPGRVLLLYGENSENSRLMLIGGLEHFKFDLEAIDVIPFSFKLADNLDQLIAEVDQEYALVMVDSSASYFSYDDENGNVDGGDHARDLRRLTQLPGKPAVLVCCHPIKGATEETLVPRGAGAFLAELDTNLTIWNNGSTAELSHNKVRGPVVDSITFNIEITPLPDTYKDTKGRGMQAPVAIAMTEQQAAEAFKRAIEDENRLLYAMLHYPAHSLSEWARDCGWVKDGKPQKYKAQRAAAKLVDEKFAVKARGQYKLTSAGKTEAEHIR